jgi:hypothetical protein
MSICIFSGEEEGFGAGEDVVEGISIPGIFIGSGEAEGCADGVCAPLCMPGMFISIFSAGAFAGCADELVNVGVFVPGLFIPAIPALFRVCCLLRTADFDFNPGLRFGLRFDLPMLMPGISCMSCCV